MKRSFFQAAVVLILLYGCNTWTLTKRMVKKLDCNYTRMLRTILNRSWRHHHTKQQLYGHLPPTTKTIQFRQTRCAEHCRRRRDEPISNVPLWTPSCGRPKAEQPARTYLQQLCADTGFDLKDLLEAMDNREGWWERVREIRDDNDDSYLSHEYLRWVKCKQPRHGFKLGLSCPFPKTITITLQAPSFYHTHSNVRVGRLNRSIHDVLAIWIRLKPRSDLTKTRQRSFRLLN